jgi:hypothetical protein
MSEMNERSHRHSIIGPLLLIGIGVLFLMNNLGVLTWSVWDLVFRLWPVFLIAAGLDIVIGRASFWGALLAVILIVGVVAFGVWTLQGNQTFGTGTTEQVSFPIRLAKRAEVRLSPVVGELHLAGTAPADQLLSGTTWVGSGMRVVDDYNALGEASSLNLRAEGAGVVFPSFGPPGQPTWDLQLSPALPVDLSAEMGVGQTVVDLRGTQVYDLSLRLGVGQQIVYLPRNGIVRANASTAIGETIVIIPPGVAARIHASTGIAARSIPGDFVRDGDNYTSPGYATAADKVDLELEVAIGNLSVRVGAE